MFARLASGLILAAALVFAQGGMGEGGMGGMGGGRGNRGGGMGDMGGGMRSQRQSKTDVLGSRLKLNGNQKAQLQDILSAAREEAAPLQQQFLQARAKIASASLNGKADADLKPLLDDYSALAAQMDSVEVRAFAKLNGILKSNQQAKAAQAFELLAQILESPGGRPAGRRAQ
jgi:hypothetical protein